jgi:hypothetical protein
VIVQRPEIVQTAALMDHYYPRLSLLLQLLPKAAVVAAATTAAAAAVPAHFLQL